MRSKLISFVFCLSLFCSNVASAAFLPAPCLSVGGASFFDCSSNLITLVARVVTAGNATTFRQNLGTATTGYTPSGIKNFRVWAVRGMNSSVSTSDNYQIGYADNDNGIEGAGAALVNPKTPGGMSAALASPVALPLAYSGDGYGAGDMGFGKGGFLIPNGKFMFATVGTSATAFIYIYGYEE